MLWDRVRLQQRCNKGRFLICDYGLDRLVVRGAQVLFQICDERRVADLVPDVPVLLNLPLRLKHGLGFLILVLPKQYGAGPVILFQELGGRILGPGLEREERTVLDLK